MCTTENAMRCKPPKRYVNRDSMKMKELNFPNIQTSKSGLPGIESFLQKLLKPRI